MLQRAIVFAAFGLAAACASTAASAEGNVGIYAPTRGPVYAAPPLYAPPPVVYAPAPILPVYGYGDKNNFYDERRWHYGYERQRCCERQRGRW